MKTYTETPLLYSKAEMTVNTKGLASKSHQKNLKDEDAYDDNREDNVLSYSCENVQLK